MGEERIEDRLRKLATKYYPTMEEVEEEMRSSARDHVQMVEIKVEHMTGKLVNATSVMVKESPGLLLLPKNK